MICRRRKLLEIFCGGLALAIVFLTLNCRADDVVLRLRNGDRIAGTILSETTSQITLSNTWVKSLVVPVSEIERRELLTNAPGAHASPANTAATNVPAPPPVVVAKTNTRPSGTNSVLAGNSPPITVPPVPPLPPPPPPQLPWYQHWKGEILVGTTLIKGATDTELYYGKGTFVYSQPYLSDPKLLFRNIFTYVADYGKTAGVLSANDMSGSSKTDFDLNRSMYTYNLGAAGYDEIRQINLHFEDGPGAGYHIFKETNFLANVELGANYQEDDQSDGSNIRSFYYRLAEDFNWKISKQAALVEKFEFFPRADLRQYRSRFESTFTYFLKTNITFNMSVVDLYDTAPATSVPNNELQFRTSLGVKF